MIVRRPTLVRRSTDAIPALRPGRAKAYRAAPFQCRPRVGSGRTRCHALLDEGLAVPPETAPLPVPATTPGRNGRRSRSVPRRREAAELLDRPGHDLGELAANLRDIRRVNRLAGGTRATLRHLPRLLATVPPEREATVLDLATGSGDIPLAVVRWARRRGRAVRVVASDVSDEILAEAKRLLGGYPEVALARYDARAVPLPDGSFDVVLCSLALHHFPPAEAAAVLRAMDRLGRHGFVLNDIRRSVPGFLAAWVSSRLGTRNRMTRHDMPLSVLRAYTPAELRALLVRAGIADATVTRHPLFRMAAVRGGRSRHPGPSGEPGGSDPTEGALG